MNSQTLQPGISSDEYNYQLSYSADFC